VDVVILKCNQKREQHLEFDVEKRISVIVLVHWFRLWKDNWMTRDSFRVQLITVISVVELDEPYGNSLNSGGFPHTLCLTYPVIRGMSCLLLLAALLLGNLITEGI
jgi:hypothetical protein